MTTTIDPMNDTVQEWLLQSDPAIRWQVMRDLADAPEDAVATERARIAHEGWGAKLLALQREDGSWAGGAYFPEWSSTTASLSLLRHLGIDPADEQVRRAIERVRDNVAWEHEQEPYFEGEVEPCINGQALAIGAYFGQDVRGIVDRLLTEQMADGGWNCEQERGSVRGSFDSTINVLEGFLEYERGAGGDAEVEAARLRGQAYLLERGLLRRLTTGEIGDRKWLYLAFPQGWHYNVLRALDHLRAASVMPDERTTEALDLVESKRDAEGRWPLELALHDELPIDLDERVDEPSRWLTLRALRVLRWAGRVDDGPGWPPSASKSAIAGAASRT